jgi:hypothetical protein
MKMHYTKPQFRRSETPQGVKDGMERLSELRNN